MKRTILVVDDEESIRYTFDSFLSEEGYGVSTAAGYHQALALFKEARFDIVITDVLLDDKTGIDLLREVRRRNQDCSVIIITGYPSLETALEAMQLGAIDYLSKPVTQQALLNVVHATLQRKAWKDRTEKSLRNLEAMIRSIRDAVILVDQNLKIIEINEGASNICGLSRDVLGLCFLDIPRSCSGNCARTVENAIRLKELVEAPQVACRMKGVTGCQVRLFVSPLLDHTGVCNGAVMVATDSTPTVECPVD